MNASVVVFVSKDVAAVGKILNARQTGINTIPKRLGEDGRNIIFSRTFARFAEGYIPAP